MSELEPVHIEIEGPNPTSEQVPVAVHHLGEAVLHDTVEAGVSGPG